MNQRSLDRIARAILLVGIAIAMSCMISGLLWLVLSGQPFAMSGLSPQQIPGAILSGDANALIDLGIIALVATPFVRVLAVLGMSVMERDRGFILISATVVGLVLIAVLIGLA